MPCWMPSSTRTTMAFAAAIIVGATLQIRDRDIGGGSPFFNGDAQQCLPHFREADRVLLNERMVDPVGTDKRGQQRAKEKRVRAGTNREMQIGHFGSFGSPGINDDQLACWDPCGFD